MLSLDYVKRFEWAPWYSREISLQKAISFSLSIGEPAQRLIGYGVFDNANVYDGRLVTGLSPAASISGIAEKVRKQFSKENFQKRFFDTADCAFGKVLSFVYSLDSAELARLPDEELASLYRTFIGLQLDSTAVMWYGFFAQEEIAGKVKQILDSTGGGDLFNSALTPLKPSYAAQEKMDLLELASKRNQDGMAPSSWNSLLAEHTRKWAFLPTYDFYYPPYSSADFESRVAGIVDPVSELVLIANAERENREKTAKVLSLAGLSTEDLNFLEFVKNFAYFKEHRNEVRAKTSFHGRLLYQEISRRFEVTLKEALFLTDDEIRDFLKSGRKPNPQEIRARMAGYVLLQSGSAYAVSVGPDASKLSSRLLQGNTSGQLMGFCASAGKVKGFAKVVNSTFDLSKLMAGDVLVSPMTRPEYVVAMKKVAAVVTDEGGLLSHAAIVSRELGIPCIVGTKNATKVLKDGDVVEVDATAGLVRKIDF